MYAPITWNGPRLYRVINSAPDAGAAAAYAWGAGAVDHALATMAAKRISAPFVWLDVETGGGKIVALYFSAKAADIEQELFAEQITHRGGGGEAKDEDVEAGWMMDARTGP